MIPDTDPDSRRPTRPADLPCSYCGRSAAERILLARAYGEAWLSFNEIDCPFCRPAPTRDDRP